MRRHIRGSFWRRSPRLRWKWRLWVECYGAGSCERGAEEALV
jgi:hypothetical protein